MEENKENQELEQNLEQNFEPTEENQEQKIEFVEQNSTIIEEKEENSQNSIEENPIEVEALEPDENIEKEPVFEQNDKDEELICVRPVKFQQFEPKAPNRSIKKNLDIMQDIQMHVSVELGRTKSSIREVMDLEQGTVVELDKIAGEQVEIFVNEKLVAKGEVIVIEDKFGVRVTSTNITKSEA